MQLLHLRWFPTTLHHPNAAFTFDFLNTFNHLNTQGKISVYDFYYSIDHKSNNIGTCNQKVFLHPQCTKLVTNTKPGSI